MADLSGTESGGEIRRGASASVSRTRPTTSLPGGAPATGAMPNVEMRLVLDRLQALEERVRALPALSQSTMQAALEERLGALPATLGVSDVEGIFSECLGELDLQALIGKGVDDLLGKIIDTIQPSLETMIADRLEGLERKIKSGLVDEPAMQSFVEKAVGEAKTELQKGIESAKAAVKAVQPDTKVFRSFVEQSIHDAKIEVLESMETSLNAQKETQLGAEAVRGLIEQRVGEVKAEILAAVESALEGKKTPDMDLVAVKGLVVQGVTAAKAEILEAVEKARADAPAPAADTESLKAEIMSVIDARSQQTATELIQGLGAAEKKLTAKIEEKVGQSVGKATGLDALVTEKVNEALAGFVASATFKDTLDKRFRVMLQHLEGDVIPRVVRKVTAPPE